MKIVFLTKGSWGDVQPVIVIAHALQRKKAHKAKIATHARYRAIIEKHGIDFAELPGDPAAIFESQEGQKMLASGQGLKVVQKLQDTHPPSPQPALEACRGMDLIVSVTMTQFECYCAAELLGTRYVRMCLVPLASTGQNPAITLPVPNLGIASLNLLTHELVEKVWWDRQAGTLNKWRVENGLDPVKNWFGMTPILRMQNIPCLAAFSPSVYPKPSDWMWDDNVCGYLFWSDELSKEEDLKLPEGMEAFLAAGPPPVYFGFGSMPAVDPAGLLKIVVDVVKATGCRAVLCAGWTKFFEEGEFAPKGCTPATRPDHKDLFICEKVPHDWLFPRCSALVIHGGVGTTAAGLRSGRPVVICPVFADQPFWGRTVQKMGCGPAPIPFKDLSAEKLSAALKQCQAPEMIAKSIALGKKIQAEWDQGDGAVQWLETVAVSVRPPVRKVATLGTGAVLAWKLKGSQFLRILMALLVLLVWWKVGLVPFGN